MARRIVDHPARPKRPSQWWATPLFAIVLTPERHWDPNGGPTTPCQPTHTLRGRFFLSFSSTHSLIHHKDGSIKFDRQRVKANLLATHSCGPPVCLKPPMDPRGARWGRAPARLRPEVQPAIFDCLAAIAGVWDPAESSLIVPFVLETKPAGLTPKIRGGGEDWWRR